jgi:predicted nucleotidyltransferase
MSCNENTPIIPQPVIETVKHYAEIVRSRFPVKRVILFGSFARGTQHPDSDIDVAIVMDKPPADILSTETELF